ncbi:hypothetical protein BDW22DRAFT_1481484 [Trametopsis cervina]|nr:hypothetical protein BDW22DRAFT_1481484 [Trametopsis cervina]
MRPDPPGEEEQSDSSELIDIGEDATGSPGSIMLPEDSPQQDADVTAEESTEEDSSTDPPSGMFIFDKDDFLVLVAEENRDGCLLRSEAVELPAIAPEMEMVPDDFGIEGSLVGLSAVAPGVPDGRAEGAEGEVQDQDQGEVEVPSSDEEDAEAEGYNSDSECVLYVPPPSATTPRSSRSATW